MGATDCGAMVLRLIALAQMLQDGWRSGAVAHTHSRQVLHDARRGVTGAYPNLRYVLHDARRRIASAHAHLRLVLHGGRRRSVGRRVLRNVFDDPWWSVAHAHVHLADVLNEFGWRIAHAEPHQWFPGRGIRTRHNASLGKEVDSSWATELGVNAAVIGRESLDNSMSAHTVRM